jgi:hypothetical protein
VGTLIWMPVYLRPHIASTLLGQSTRAVHDLRSGIATMVKPPAGVRDRNGTQRLCVGVERRFFRSHLSAMTRRPLLGTLTCRPRWAKRRSPTAASGASGCAGTQERTTASAASLQRARRLPAWGRGTLSPVRRRRRFSTNDWRTPTRAARARREPSRCASVRRSCCRRSRK